MQLFQLSFYVPSEALEAVKQAIFEAGAGQVGHYDCCAWQTLGQGQFRPLDQANPFIGQVGRVTFVEEYKVETVCQEAVLLEVIAALKSAHPYEEVAYMVVPLWQG